uniref:hypothetical protein n=1 Tax=Vibrio harveyi TaxID=669 RepID=UPI0018F17E54
MKSIITILVAIALVGCNSSTDDTTYTPEAIVEFDLPPQKIQKNHTGYFANENLKIKALVKQGQIASFNWRANESDINLINSHTDTISFTTPLVTGYSDLHQPGVIRTIYLDLIDTVNRKQTLELKIRLFPVIKDVSLDEELINLGFTDEDIDSLCSTPTPDNGNYYNVKDSSVHCLVSKGEAIIRFN